MFGEAACERVQSHVLVAREGPRPVAGAQSVLCLVGSVQVVRTGRVWRFSREYGLSGSVETGRT